MVDLVAVLEHVVQERGAARQQLLLDGVDLKLGNVAAFLEALENLWNSSSLAMFFKSMSIWTYSSKVPRKPATGAGMAMFKFRIRRIWLAGSSSRRPWSGPPAACRERSCRAPNRKTPKPPDRTERHRCEDAGRDELAAGDAAAAAAGDGHEEQLAKTSKDADLVEQIAFGLGQRLQGNGPAAAAQEGLDDIEVHVGDADRVLAGAGQGNHGLVGELDQQQGAGGEQLADAGAAVQLPVVGFAGRRSPAAPLPDSLPRDRKTAGRRRTVAGSRAERSGKGLRAHPGIRGY